MKFEGYGETGDKILASAEELFARHGYDGVSLRQITAHAGVNLAAVNYHHTDKRSLCIEIITYRLRQLSTVRLEMLTTAEAAAGDAPVSLEKLSDVLARPLLLSDAFGGAGRRLLGRVLIEPLAFTAPVIAREFQPAMTRCGQAIRRHLPGVPPAKFLWQLSLIVGALHHTAATLHDMEARTSGFVEMTTQTPPSKVFEKLCWLPSPANAFRP